MYICYRKAPYGEVVGPKSLHIQDLRIHGFSIGQIRFWFWFFNFGPRSDFHQKTLKKCKCSPIFYLKGRRDMSWFCNFWIAQWLNFFLQNSFFCDFGHLQVEKRGQSWKLWVSLVFAKIWIFQRFLKHCFCFLEY